MVTGTLAAVSPEQPRQVGEHTNSTLDVLWVSTVPRDELHPRIRRLDGRDPLLSSELSPDETRPVHGTLTVDVRDAHDRRLLERLLNTHRVLSVTAADGWTQRVRLTGIRRIHTETAVDGSHIVVATYTWVAAASLN